MAAGSRPVPPLGSRALRRPRWRSHRHRPHRGDGDAFAGCPCALAKSYIDVAVDLLQASPQLLDPVHRIFDPAGQLAHLRLEPIHAEFGIDRRTGARDDGRAAASAVDLPLQHAEIPLQAIETVLRTSDPAIALTGVGKANGENHQQQGWTGMRQGRAPEHSEGLLKSARKPGVGALAASTIIGIDHEQQLCGQCRLTVLGSF